MFRSMYKCSITSGDAQTQFYLTVFATILMLLATSNLLAQQGNGDDELPKGTVPPPLNELTTMERATLEKQKKLSKRTKLTLKLMESRLRTVERQFSVKKFGEALKNLGGFRGLMQKTFNELMNRKVEKKTLKSLKKFEIGLRGFINRVEVLRRTVPDRYEYHYRRLVKDIKKTRDLSIEPLFGKVS